jgi:hypothetical protein
MSVRCFRSVASLIIARSLKSRISTRAGSLRRLSLSLLRCLRHCPRADRSEERLGVSAYLALPCHSIGRTEENICLALYHFKKNSSQRGREPDIQFDANASAPSAQDFVCFLFLRCPIALALTNQLSTPLILMLASHGRMARTNPSTTSSRVSVLNMHWFNN